jgi:hypothetical protein
MAAADTWNLLHTADRIVFPSVQTVFKGIVAFKKATCAFISMYFAHEAPHYLLNGNHAWLPVFGFGIL